MRDTTKYGQSDEPPLLPGEKAQNQDTVCKLYGLDSGSFQALFISAKMAENKIYIFKIL